MRRCAEWGDEGMLIIDRTTFTSEPNGGFTGSVQFDTRTVEVTIRPTADETDLCWENAEVILTHLRDEMPSIENRVSELFSRLGLPRQDTPKGWRKIGRMLRCLRESDMTCLVYADGAATVYFDGPRLTDHIVEVTFTKGGKLSQATIAG